jgi:hypothetical protein
VAALAAIEPAVVTAPNFSLFLNVPRENDLHNMKRIALCWHELTAAGIPAALHVNARTDHDWSRWAEFIRARSEVTTIAFEFATGARSKARGEWHVKQLVLLRERVGRDLALVLRGEQLMKELTTAYPQIVHINTSPYVKTIKRYQAIQSLDGALAWRKSMTMIDEPIDGLLQRNVDVVCPR